MKCFRRRKIILLREPKINQDRHALVGKENVGRPGEADDGKHLRHSKMRKGVDNALNVIVYNSTLVQEVNATQEGAEPFFGTGFGDFDGD